MVLITFIYVVATIEICRANIKSAEATKEQLEESKRQFAENERLQMMPYFEIIVHDDIRDFVECIELAISNSNAENSTVIDRRISIKNIGLGVAKDFTYTWCNLDGCYPRNDLGFTAFAPGEEKSIYFDFYAKHKEDFSEYEAQVSMIFYYSDLLENKYSVVLNLVFRIAKDGEVDITDYHVSIPRLAEMGAPGKTGRILSKWWYFSKENVVPPLPYSAFSNQNRNAACGARQGLIQC